MTCNKVIELFPELLDGSLDLPEARQHLETCETCRAQFEMFRQCMEEIELETLSPQESQINCEAILKRSGRSRIMTIGSRIATVAAAVLLVFVTALGPVENKLKLKNIPDYVLLEASDAQIVPDMQQPSDEDMLEYLAYYADMNSLSDIY